MNQNCINSGTCHKVYFTVNQYCSWPSGQQNWCILKMIWHLDFICSLEMMIWMMWLSILNWKTTSVFRVTKQVSIYWCSDEMKKIHASMWLMILMRYKLVTNIEFKSFAFWVWFYYFVCHMFCRGSWEKKWNLHSQSQKGLQHL